MFGWLKRLWTWLLPKRGGFSERERAIFKYWTGSAYRWADPFEIQRALEKHGGKGWMSMLRGLDAGGGIKLEKMSEPVRTAVVESFHHAVKQVADLVRLSFHVQPIGSISAGSKVAVTGLTDSECVDLLASYLDFLADLEDEFRPLLLPPMEEPAPPSEGDDSTIEQSSGLPETGNACEMNEPKTLPEESQSLCPVSRVGA